jgi:inhibitor of nuclear factor kappa-B kinase subunit alpha
VKTGAQAYQEDVLQGVVTPLNTTVFNGQKWVFQQDSAPAHKAKVTQEWLWRNVPAFISAILEDMACRKHHNNLDGLKRSLVKAAAEIPLDTVGAAIAEWPEHRKACIEAEGSHFE